MDGGSVWRFRIREDIKFSDGVIVDNSVVKSSLNRIFFLLRKQNTQYIFINSLKEVERLKTASTEIEGLRVESGELVLSFSKPIPNLPELLSIGHFSIVHPKDYDHQTGEWTANNLISSRGAGPYLVEKVEESAIHYRVRVNYPLDLTHQKRFNFLVQTNLLSLNDPPQLFRAAENIKLNKKEFRFYGTGGRSIVYIRVLPWNVASGFWSVKKNRIRIREVFYKELEKLGPKVKRSFIPTLINGVSEIEAVDGGVDDAWNLPEKISFNDARPASSVEINNIYSAVENAIISIGAVPQSIKRVNQEEIHESKNPMAESHPLDLVVAATGFSLDQPLLDLRLMFSKEGIWLPDPKGGIHAELESIEPNFQKINKAIVDDAIVWPVFNNSLGFWAHEDLDLSDYNVLKPLGELQWIGQK